MSMARNKLQPLQKAWCLHARAPKQADGNTHTHFTIYRNNAHAQNTHDDA